MRRIGVCSWSLQPADEADLVTRITQCGINTVQLAFEPIRSGAWDEQETRQRLSDAGIRVLSGMMSTVDEDYSTLESIERTGGVRPNEHWHENLERAKTIAAMAARWRVPLVTFHAGFLPHHACAERSRLLDRLRTLANLFQSHDVKLGLETGQERAETLIDALSELDHSNIGVNFDPANILLYGMGDPVDALQQLSPHVVQMHIKDAVATIVQGTWGQEVITGRGGVDWHRLMKIVNEQCPGIDLVIEREAGHSRVADVRAAHDLVRSFLR